MDSKQEQTNKDGLYAAVLEECRMCITDAEKLEWEKIDLHYLIGEQIDILLKHYNLEIVGKLSKDISRSAMKLIRKETLFDCFNVYNCFDSKEDLRNTTNNIVNPVSWKLLVDISGKSKKEIDKNNGSDTLEVKISKEFKVIFNRLNKLEHVLKNEFLKKQHIGLFVANLASLSQKTDALSRKATICQGMEQGELFLADHDQNSEEISDIG